MNAMHAYPVLMKNLLVDEDGASATEYAVMIVLVILIAITAITLLGQQVNRGFNTFVEQFTSAQGN